MLTARTPSTDSSYLTISNATANNGKIAITTSSDEARKEFLAGRDLAERLRITDSIAHSNQIKQAHELAGRIALAEKNYDTAATELAQANQQNPDVLYLLGFVLSRQRRRSQR